MVSYRLPHAHLDARLGGRGLRTGVAIDGRGVGGVVPALMKALWEVGEDAGVSAARDLEDSFASAVAAATAALAGPGKPDRAAVRAAVLQHVRDSLTDRTLSVTTVCRRFAISPRTLHNLFADAEVSFAATVRGLRLDRCAALLADPGVTATVTEIAAAHGFDDPTSFSRAFRRRFGVSPGRSAEAHRARTARPSCAEGRDAGAGPAGASTAPHRVVRRGALDGRVLPAQPRTGAAQARRPAVRRGAPARSRRRRRGRARPADPARCSPGPCSRRRSVPASSRA